jgi:hypothetical protein
LKRHFHIITQQRVISLSYIITRLFEEISREMKASVLYCGAFIKISIIFEEFFIEIETFSRIARIFKYIFSGKEVFVK